MKIVELRVHPIAIADPPLRSSYGLHQPYALRTILELVSDEGLVGIAETHGGDTITSGFRAVEGRIIDADPFRLAGLLIDLVEGDVQGSSLDRSQTFHVPGENPLDMKQRLYSALEIAALDLCGRALKKPVCDLLGGRVRDEVAFSAYPFYKHAGGGGEGDDARQDAYGEALAPEPLVRQVKQMVAEYGFKDIKFKTGVLDPQVEIETVRQLHAAFPKLPIRMDPNCAWSVETSVKVGKALRKELGNGGYLEDPTAGMDGMSAVRRRLLEAGIETPLGSNVAVTCFPDLAEAVQKKAVQVVLSDVHYWGGLRATQHLGKLCKTFGLGLSMHSNSHLGISVMTMAHAAAVTPHLTYACDTHYPWSDARDEVVLGGKVRFHGGAVRIPDRPGLGVDIDQDQLARGRERFVKCPYRKRDDTAEMRKHVDPNWTRILPRW
ncbi:MAG TPA: enolase C-terminal domain-like protein [Planctomycetota bacterium]|nr:enolase C-terminal domain-like protein [Planctomycetota bacterium]